MEEAVGVLDTRNNTLRLHPALAKIQCIQVKQELYSLSEKDNQWRVISNLTRGINDDEDSFRVEVKAEPIFTERFWTSLVNFRD